MKTKFTAMLSFMLIFLVCACIPEKFKTNEVYHGFKLVEKRFVKEVNAECLYFEHVKSGARLFKIAAEDANKTFAISFKTVPENDCGAAHVMEHSLLGGSKKFPVKNIFGILMTGSLNTYLDAFTGPDEICFPIASMNTKDYFNLMHVYLDAVFNPLIYDNPRIFKQEGWHYELTEKEDDIVYKGVVYNEMKGIFSSPDKELTYQINRHLFPENTYGVACGGYPSAIPNLTYEAFIDFHKTYYHPSNSYIFLYGDADLNRELEFINTNYLSEYEKSDKKITIPLQQPFAKMKEVEKTYSVAKGSSTENKTYLSLSFVAGLGTDQAQNLAFDVLADALVNHETAPVRLALQEAGISNNISAYYSENKQNVFKITAKDANPEDSKRFKEIVFETFKKVIQEGLDKTIIEGIINRMEFKLKEGNSAQKGMMYRDKASNNWRYGNNPFKGLEFEQKLIEVKKALNTNLLESLIEKHLLPNPHSLLMVLKPEPGKQQKIDAQTHKKLADFKQQLSEKEIEKLINETEELLACQKQEDSPETIATVPSLKLSDIGKEVEWYGIDEKSVAGIPMLHHNTFTNNIVYTDLYFDMRVLPQELIPYASMLSTILTQLSTENYTFSELDNALNIHTGGVYTKINTFLKDKSDNQLLPKFIIGGKATANKTDKLFELIEEFVKNVKINDKERLKTLLIRHQANIDPQNRPGGGYHPARIRVSSYYSNNGIFEEQTDGIDYYHFITQLVDNFDDNNDEIIKKIQQTASLLFVKKNLTAAVTCSNEDIPNYSKGLEKLIGTLSEEEPNYIKWEFDFKQKNEGLLSASKVQFVLKGYDFKKLGYKWNGKIRVLDQVLSGWLWNKIRVIGGAYGGYCSFSSTGDVYFSSYYDPNLKETIENYDAIPGFLEKFDADDASMTRNIIGAISDMNQLLTPLQRGERAVQYYFENTTIDQLKAEREAVLTTTVQDIRDMKKMVSDILAQDAFCVYGNEEKIKENKELFKNLVKVSK